MVKTGKQRQLVTTCGKELLSRLAWTERMILELRHGLYDGDGFIYTLEEVAKIFKMPRERIRQLEQNAIRKLQTWIAKANAESATLLAAVLDEDRGF